MRALLRSLLRRGREKAKEVVLRALTPRLPLPPEVARWRVVLVGASVGSAWRLHLVYPRVETLATYQFDKSALVQTAISRRPDAIIIKECSAYFPDGGEDRELVTAWVDQIQQSGIKPILATVVPVTRAHAAFFPGRAEALWAFNDWLRDLCQRRRLPLLDLERALSVSADERYLRDDLDDGDGMHLARRTYREHLDQLVPEVLLAAARQRG